MKKIIILSLLFAFGAYSQTPKQTSADRLADAWLQLKRSKDTAAMLITDIKRMADQKIIYRTKIIEHTDTIWRIDTCITKITKLDSATVVLMFMQPDSIKTTKVGRIIRYIFHGKKVTK